MLKRAQIFFGFLLSLFAAMTLSAQTSQTSLVVVTNVVCSNPTIDLTVRLPQQPSVPSDPFKDYSSIFAALIAVFGVALTAYFTMRRGRKDAQFTYASVMMKYRLQQVQEFYAPIDTLIEQSHQVYNKLLSVLDTIRPEISKDFRLLDHIFELKQDRNFCAFVDQILVIGDKISSLIVDKAGLIEGGVTPVFKEYLAHFSILRAASGQDFTADQKDRFLKHGYYPRSLNREIREGYKTVLQYLDQYAKASDGIISRLINGNLLDIGLGREDLVRNLRYYEANAAAYADRFDGFDLSMIQQRFVDELNRQNGNVPSRRLLDLGCGTGRDAEWFIKHGFSVTAIDYSPAMLRFCRKRIDALKTKPETAELAKNSTCIEMTFDEMDFRSEFDGIWASASLLHIPHDELLQNVRRLVWAVKKGGCIYLSLKYGRGDGEYGGRYFAYYSRARIMRVIKAIPEAKCTKLWMTDNLGKELTIRAVLGNLWPWSSKQPWLNLLIQRK